MTMMISRGYIENTLKSTHRFTWENIADDTTTTTNIEHDVFEHTTSETHNAMCFKITFPLLVIFFGARSFYYPAHAIFHVLARVVQPLLSTFHPHLVAPASNPPLPQ